MNLKKLARRANPRYIVEAAGFWLRHQVHGPQRYTAVNPKRKPRRQELRQRATAACVLGLLAIGLVAGRACNVMFYCRIL